MKRRWPWIVVPLVLFALGAAAFTFALAARAARQRGSVIASEEPRPSFPDPGPDPFGAQIARGLLPARGEGDAGAMLLGLPGVAPGSPLLPELRLLAPWDESGSDQTSQQILGALAGHPAVDHLVGASRFARAVLVGNALPLDPDGLVMTARMPDYFAIVRWVRVLLHRVDLREERGDAALAHDDLVAAVIVGRALQHESTLGGMVSGLMIEARAARRMAELEQRRGEGELARRWIELGRDAARRRELVRRFVRFLQGSWTAGSVSELERIALRRDLPLSWRSEALTAIGEGWLTVSLETWLGPDQSRRAALLRFASGEKNEPILRALAERLLRSLDIPFAARVRN